MNYYISDLHLGHANAIGFDGRPFADVTEMNETLIHRWNNTVNRADTVYVLGDFIWEKESLWPAWLERLTGNKVLIRGNHDPRQFSQATKRFFQNIADYKEITDTGWHVILCHFSTFQSIFSQAEKPRLLTGKGVHSQNAPRNASAALLNTA